MVWRTGGIAVGGRASPPTAVRGADQLSLDRLGRPHVAHLHPIARPKRRLAACPLNLQAVSLVERLSSCLLTINALHLLPDTKEMLHPPPTPPASHLFGPPVLRTITTCAASPASPRHGSSSIVSKPSRCETECACGAVRWPGTGGGEGGGRTVSRR